MEKNKNVSYFLRQSAVGLASVSAAFRLERLQWVL